MVLTPIDWALLTKAHGVKAVDNQLVLEMVEKAESGEGKNLLRYQWQYLCNLEKQLAGVL